MIQIRFGFQPAFRFNIRSQWEGIPDKAFMVLFMDDNAMKNVSGVATFREEFNDALKKLLRDCLYKEGNKLHSFTNNT